MDKQKHFYLFRGLVREARHWHDFPEHLLTHFPGAKLTTIDIPGAGEFHSVTTPLSIKGMVEIMRRKYLECRQEGEEAVLVAVSLGGMIASAWMKLHPWDFHRAIFINTSFGDLSPVHHRMKPLALAYLLRVPFLKGRDKEAHILKLVSNNPERFETTLRLWEEICLDKAVGSGNTIRQLLAAALYASGAFVPPIPVYLIGSTNDRMVSIECSRAIARKWKVPLVEHPKGGHDLTSDYPEWVADKIREFVRTAESQASGA